MTGPVQISGAPVEISFATRYARAGAYVVEQGLVEAAEISVVHDEGLPGDVEPAELSAAVVGEQVAEQPSAQPARYPLRRRAARIREAGHIAYYDARTPGEGLTAAHDYFRSAAARAAKGGMHHPATEDAFVDLGRALKAAADALTAAMHTWRPES